MIATALTCPQCSASLEVPEERTQFFCKYCGATVVVPESMRSAPRSDDAEPERLRRPLDLSRFTIDKQGDTLAVSWNWSRAGGVFLLLFSLFWCGFISVFFLAPTGDGEWIFKLFALPFLAIGIGMMYAAAGLLVNRTEILVHDGVLEIWHGPLPWKKPPAVETKNVSQLFVFERVKQGKYGPSYTYELQALQADGPVLVLLSGEQTPDTCRAVERLLETHLGIEDRRVEDEHG